MRGQPGRVMDGELVVLQGAALELWPSSRLTRKKIALLDHPVPRELIHLSHTEHARSQHQFPLSRGSPILPFEGRTDRRFIKCVRPSGEERIHWHIQHGTCIVIDGRNSTAEKPGISPGFDFSGEQEATDDMQQAMTLFPVFVFSPSSVDVAQVLPM